MRKYQTPPKERAPALLALRLKVLIHRDATHVIPMIGTARGAEIARRTYREVYGGVR